MLTSTLRLLRFSMPLLALVILPADLQAQVGHAPASSPFADILYGSSFTVLGGDFAGDGGKLGVGPHHGHTYALRYDIRVSTPIQLGLAIGGAHLERQIVDAHDSVATRVTGPFTQNLTTVELALQFNLTGRKTWHRLAPYFGVGLGLAFGGKGLAADTSGYTFGTRAYVAPNVGLRLFLTKRLHLRAEARQTYWRLKYPSVYLLDPSKELGNPVGSKAPIQDGRLQEWTGGRNLVVGAGYAVSF